jgi:hypothetical protein
MPKGGSRVGRGGQEVRGECREGGGTRREHRGKRASVCTYHERIGVFSGVEEVDEECGGAGADARERQQTVPGELRGAKGVCACVCVCVCV